MRVTGVKPDASRQQRRMIPTMMHCTLGQFQKDGVAASVAPGLSTGKLIEMVCFDLNQ